MSADTRGLDQLLRLLKENKLVARVGIIGGGDQRKDGLSNAQIGAKHEFGEEGMPIRSFLRMPIHTRLQKLIESKGGIQKNAMEIATQQGSLETLIKKLGAAGKRVVLDAFETTGFGQWKKSNMNHKTVKQTLVESGDLRDHIGYDIEKKS